MPTFMIFWLHMCREAWRGQAIKPRTSSGCDRQGGAGSDADESGRGCHGCVVDGAELLLSLRQGRGHLFSGGKEPMEGDHQGGGFRIWDGNYGGDDMPGSERQERSAEAKELISCPHGRSADV